MASQTHHDTSIVPQQVVHFGNKYRTQQNLTSGCSGQAYTFSDATVFETPIMTLHEATSHINAFLEYMALDYADETTVTLAIQDAEGAVPQWYSNELTIETNSTLKDFILKVQEEVNFHAPPEELNLIITNLDIIIDGLMVAIPSIKGERVLEKHCVPGAPQVRWKIDSETKQFYTACKRLLLFIGDGEDVTRPYFKVTTANKIDGEGPHLEHDWHTFDNVTLINGMKITPPQRADMTRCPTRGDLQISIESLALNTSVNATMAERNIGWKDIHAPDIVCETTNPQTFALDHTLFPDLHLPVSVRDWKYPQFPVSTTPEMAGGVDNAKEIAGERSVMSPHTNCVYLNCEAILRSAPEKDAEEAAIGFDSDDDEAFFDRDPQIQQHSYKPKAPSTAYKVQRFSRPKRTGTFFQAKPLIAEDRRMVKQNTSVIDIQALGVGFCDGSGSGTSSDSSYLKALATTIPKSYSSFGCTMPTAASKQQLAAVATNSSSVQFLDASPAVTKSAHHSSTANESFGLNPGSCGIPSSNDSHQQIFREKTDAEALATAYPCTRIEACMNGVQAITQPSYFQGNSSRNLPAGNISHSRYPLHTPIIAASTAPKAALTSPVLTILDQNHGTSMRVSQTNAGCNALKQHAYPPLRAEKPEFRSSGTNAGTSQTYHAPNTTPRSRAYAPTRKFASKMSIEKS